MLDRHHVSEDLGGTKQVLPYHVGGQCTSLITRESEPKVSGVASTCKFTQTGGMAEK